MGFWDNVLAELDYRGMTNKTLAEKAGFEASNIGRGIRLKSSPSADTAVKIAKILNKAVKEKSPLEKNIDKIGKIITFGVLAIVAVVFLIEILFASNLTFLEAFLIAVALAVAAIPESLPAVITIIMALGVERLAKIHI